MIWGLISQNVNEIHEENGGKSEGMKLTKEQREKRLSLQDKENPTAI